MSDNRTRQYQRNEDKPTLLISEAEKELRDMFRFAFEYGWAAQMSGDYDSGNLTDEIVTATLNRAIASWNQTQTESTDNE